jgi:type I restriction enzyme S subunit
MREDWIETEIGDVAKLYQPKTISSKMLVADGKYDVYGANGIIGKYDKFNHEEEEFLITCRGATCGNVHITKPFSWINGNAMVVKPFDQELLSLEYLKFVFSNKGRIQKAISGSAQPQITRSTLSPIKTPIAPLPEQRAIVAKIEELFSDLDKGIADLKKAQDQLKIYRQAVLKKAFEGELTKVKTKPKIIKLGSVIDKPRYGTSKKCSLEQNGTVVLRIPNIGDGVVNTDELKYAIFNDKEASTLALLEGDILTIRSNGSVDLVGKCALITKHDIDYLYAGYLIRLRPDLKKINPKFLLHCLKSHDLRVQIESKAKSTSGVNNINSGELESLEIPHFGLDEQYHIVEEIESRLSVCDKVEQSIAESLEKARALRQSILKKAFEGTLLSAEEIAKCKTAPDYEPASVLLEKIKAEKKKK